MQNYRRYRSGTEDQAGALASVGGTLGSQGQNMVVRTWWLSDCILTFTWLRLPSHSHSLSGEQPAGGRDEALKECDVLIVRDLPSLRRRGHGAQRHLPPAAGAGIHLGVCIEVLHRVGRAGEGSESSDKGGQDQQRAGTGGRRDGAGSLEEGARILRVIHGRQANPRLGRAREFDRDTCVTEPSRMSLLLHSPYGLLPPPAVISCSPTARSFARVRKSDQGAAAAVPGRTSAGCSRQHRCHPVQRRRCLRHRLTEQRRRRARCHQERRTRTSHAPACRLPHRWGHATPPPHGTMTRACPGRRRCALQEPPWIRGCYSPSRLQTERLARLRLGPGCWRPWPATRRAPGRAPRRGSSGDRPVLLLLLRLMHNTGIVRKRSGAIVNRMARSARPLTFVGLCRIVAPLGGVIGEAALEECVRTQQGPTRDQLARIK